MRFVPDGVNISINWYDGFLRYKCELNGQRRVIVKGSQFRGKAEFSGLIIGLLLKDKGFDNR